MPQIRVEGFDINYEFAGDVTKKRPAVIFIHGACQGCWNWKNQISYFKNYSRFNFFAPDLPGHGNSEGNGFGSIKAYAVFLHGFIQELKIEEFILIGHSMGGRICQEFMIDNPVAVTGAVLCGTGARLRVTRATLSAVEKNFKHFAGIASVNSFSDSTPEELKNDFKSRLLKSKADTCLNDMLACNEFDVRDELSKIDVPVLLVAAEEDVLAPVKYSRELNEKIAGSTMKIISGSGHFMMLEQPDEFNRLVRDFLDLL